MTGNKPLRVSVGDLVAFGGCQGDLHSSSRAGPTAQQGVVGHQQMRQARQGWLAEVGLSQTFDLDLCRLSVAGRADFIWQSEDGSDETVVEEIKTCLGDPSLGFGDAAHWAQAKIYAYLYGKKHQQSQIRVQLTRLDLLSEQVHSESELHELAALEAFCLELVNVYAAWLTKVDAKKHKVAATAATLAFPFARFRAQQQAFARHIYRCVRDQRDLLVEAPTGSGKTISVLFPLAKTFAEPIVSQAIFLTAKTSGQTVALSNLNLLRQKGLLARVVQLTAKSKICPCLSSQSQDHLNEQQQCLRCVGFYDRLPAARAQALEEDWLDAVAIERIAEQHRICPFELSVIMAAWMDWVVADVNYWFDPAVRLALFDTGAARALLVDEIHNLPSRARDMLTASISSDDLDLLARSCAHLPLQNKLQRGVKRCQKLLANLVSKCTEALVAEPPKELITNLAETQATVEQARVLADTQEARQGLALTSGADLNQALMPLRRFGLIAELASESHYYLVGTRGSSEYCQILCVDAGGYLATRFQAAQSLVGFSASLSPRQYYLDNLGLAEQEPQDLHQLQLPSFFPPEHKLCLLVPYVDTRWQARADSVANLCEAIDTVVAANPGHYLVFLPSFDYMELVSSYLGCNPRQWQWQAQARSSDEQSVKDFMAYLLNEAPAKQGAVSLAVLGGRFAEAVDLPGSQLRGVIIVGTGMAQPDLVAKTVQNYWQAAGKNGFDYSFRIPGFAKIQQAAGRVVRSETDRGVVVLIDPRFTTPVYRTLLANLGHCKALGNSSELCRHLQRFWAKGEQS